MKAKTMLALGFTVVACIRGFPDADAITVAADGKVGINAPYPQYQLDVGGSVRASGSVSAVGIVPVGAIVPFHPNIVSPPLPIPDGWQVCDGNQVTDQVSPLYGASTPNLNVDGRFVRGGTVSGLPQDQQLQDHKHDFAGWSPTNQTDPGSYVGARAQANLHTTNPTTGNHGSETRPINMSVVWIIRIK